MYEASSMPLQALAQVLKHETNYGNLGTSVCYNGLYNISGIATPLSFTFNTDKALKASVTTSCSQHHHFHSNTMSMAYDVCPTRNSPPPPCC